MVHESRSKPTREESTARRTALLFLFTTIAVLAAAGLATVAVGTTLAEPQEVSGATGFSPADNGTAGADAFGTTVYVGSNNGTVYAIDVDGSTPEKLWEHEAGDAIDSSPTVADGTVYVNPVDSGLYALDADTGSVEWTFTTLSDSVGSPTIVDGVVYVADGSLSGDNVYALDADTGDRIWGAELPTSVDGAPHVVEDTVYVSGFDFADGGLFALDADTGDRQWHYDRTDGVEGSPTWADGTVYVADRLPQGGIHAIDADTGQQEWVLDKPEAIASSAVVASGTAYFPTGTSGAAGLYAVDTDTGQQEWFFDDLEGAAYMEGSATVVDGTVYFGTLGNNGSAWGGGRENSSLYAVDAKTGDLEWEFDDPATRIASTPTVHDGVVYVGAGTENKYDPDGNGTLYAVDADTGKELFDYENPQPSSGFASSPTVVVEANGDSVGSRVTQGILGHTDSFPSATGVEGTLTDVTGEPIQGGTVTVLGESKDAATDGSGQYAIGLDPGEYTLELAAPGFETVTVSATVREGEFARQDGELSPAHRVGDVDRNGELSIVDAVRIQRHLADVDPGPFDPVLADVQRTGEASIVDAVLIQQYLAELRDAASADVVDLNVSGTGSTDAVTVTTTIQNTGGMGTLQSVEHRLAAEKNNLDDATRTVEGIDLGPGDEQTLSFTVDTAALDPGTYYYEVVTDDDSETVEIQVGSDGAADVSIDGS